MKRLQNTSFYLLLTLLVFSCDPWEDHISFKSPNLGKNIYEIIKENPDLSTFANMISICGYDSLLASGNSFTVFALKNENLSGIDLNDTINIKGIVRNHIAFLTFSLYDGKFNSGSVKMLNSKNITLSGNRFGDANVDIASSNMVCGNGLLHFVDKIQVPLGNIWEIISGMDDYKQVKFIKSINMKVMDMDRSIQIGFNSNSRPIYDTVFYNVNSYLNAYSLDNEDSVYSFILLKNEVFDRLHTKYKKYFWNSLFDTTTQKNTINYEITRDMALVPVIISANGMKCISKGGIKVDLSVDSVVSTIKASNGQIYVMNGANVKMFENKIKTQIIEGEDFVSKFSQRNSESAIRIRSYASSGMDVMLSGWSRTYTYILNGSVVTQSPYNTLTDNGTLARTWNYYYNTGLYSNVANAYFEYRPVLYSIPYKIFWVAYDDIASHYSGFTDTLQTVFELEQKMFVSFYKRPSLTRGANGEINNNFSSATVFAGKSYAGTLEEKQLFKYSTDGTAQMLLYKVLDENKDAVSNQLVVPSYGTAKVWVTNSPRAIGQYSGMIFLDYIKFQPIVDVNE